MSATREAWLLELVEQLRPIYDGELPESVRISTGFTSKGIRSNRVGECWHPAAADDKTPHVFIHPAVVDSGEVAAIVAHELIHACRPDAKHGRKFRQMAEAIGLTGPMRSTVAGEQFKTSAAPILETIGVYPHARLNGGNVPSTGAKQSTRLLKVECPVCGYTVRTTRKWLDIAVPCCPVDDVEMVVEQREDEAGK